MENTQLELGTHRIRWDGKYNWIISEPTIRTTRKTGEKYEGEENLRYYPRLDDAAVCILRDRLGKLGKHNSVAELIATVKQCEADLRAAVLSEIKKHKVGSNGS